MHRVQSLRAGAIVAATLAATSAFGQARLYAPEQTCARIKSAVQQEGAIIINTSPRTYDRYVSNGSYCFYNQITRAEWVRAADQDECFIGYTCAERDRTRFR